MPIKVLCARLGQSLVLLRLTQSRLFFLNPVAAWLFEAHEAGLSEIESAQTLAHHFGMTEAETLVDVRKTLSWLDLECEEEIPLTGVVDRGNSRPEDISIQTTFLHGNNNGLQQSQAPSSVGEGWSEELGPQPPLPENSLTWQRTLADRSIVLHIDNPELAKAVTGLFAHLPAADCQPCGQTLRLAGSTAAWSLYVDDQWRASGAGIDEATVTFASALLDLGAALTERLLVLHAAALVSPDGIALALIAPGGSGKSTLAAALNSQGYALLSDDVVPVTADGQLVGLGTCLCLKAGSWEVLASRSAALNATRSVTRLGVPARFIAPTGNPVSQPVMPDLFLFPHYDPKAQPAAHKLEPEEALQRIVEAQSLIRNLDQQKLDALVNWVASVPAYALVYPNLDTGLALVREQVSLVCAARQTAEC
jgi:hypothetical protein